MKELIFSTLGSVSIISLIISNFLMFKCLLLLQKSAPDGQKEFHKLGIRKVIKNYKKSKNNIDDTQLKRLIKIFLIFYRIGYLGLTLTLIFIFLASIFGMK